MTALAIYLTILTILAILCSALDCYTRNKLGKHYKVIDGLSSILTIVLMVTIGNGIREKFWADKSFGMDILAMFIGIAVACIIYGISLIIFSHIWPKDDDRTISTIKTPTWLSNTNNILYLLFSLGFAGLSIYGLFIGISSHNVKVIVLSSLLIALFTFGTIDGIRRVIKMLKK